MLQPGQKQPALASISSVGILIGLPSDELLLPGFAPYVAITCVFGSLLYVDVFLVEILLERSTLEVGQHRVHTLLQYLAPSPIPCSCPFSWLPSLYFMQLCDLWLPPSF